ncbi:uncharacterized protein LOC144652067 isoform X2 [Oculina patagonica]
MASIAAKWLSLIITAGMLWTAVQPCHRAKCKLRSVFRQTASSSPALLKVEGSYGNVTGIAFVGERNQPNSTEFLIKRCLDFSPSGRFIFIVTLHWNVHPSYKVASRNGRVELEETTSTTSAHRFYLGNASDVRYLTLKSKSTSQLVEADLQGQITLGNKSNTDRKTWFMLESCTQM